MLIATVVLLPGEVYMFELFVLCPAHWLGQMLPVSLSVHSPGDIDG